MVRGGLLLVLIRSPPQMSFVEVDQLGQSELSKHHKLLIPCLTFCGALFLNSLELLIAFSESLL